MALSLLASNNAQTVLSSGISSTATTLTVNTGTGSLFPSPVSGVSFFKLTLIDAATGTLTEIVHVTQRSGDTMTVVRGQEGTSSRIWSANDIAANMMTAGTLSYVIDNFAPIESPALTGIPTAPTAAAGTSNTQIASTAFVQTLINNTIGSGALTSSTSWNFSVGVNISGTLRKVIFQGGTKSDSGSGARTLSVAFPVVFPNAVLDMHANDIGGAAYPFGTGWTSTSSGSIYVPAYSVGTSSTPQATSNLTVRWFAIGY